MKNAKRNWSNAEKNTKKRSLIMKIIGLYDIMEYYYCKGNVLKLRKFMKIKEEENKWLLQD